MGTKAIPPRWGAKTDIKRALERDPYDPSALAAADLYWYFREREGAMGLKGMGFEPSPGGEDLDPLSEEGILAVVRKERPIRHALFMVGYAHYRVLDGFYGFWPQRSFSLGEAYESIVLLTEDARALAKHPQTILGDVERALRGPDGEMVRARLRAACKRLIRDAATEYVGARNTMKYRGLR